MRVLDTNTMHGGSMQVYSGYGMGKMFRRLGRTLGHAGKTALNRGVKPLAKNTADSVLDQAFSGEFNPKKALASGAKKSLVRGVRPYL